MSATATFSQPKRSFLDFVGAALCLWAAAYHTPVGALVRDLGARVFSSKASTRPLLAYYSGGVYDAQELGGSNPNTFVPQGELLATIPPGRALGRGVFASAATLSGEARAPVDALARRYGLPMGTPEDAARVVEKASAELGSDDAAVLAVFAGYEVASYAARRAGAEGHQITLEVLSRQLPPTSGRALSAASTALMLGTAYGLSWPVAPGTRVSSPFGWRHHPTLGRGQLHTGVDLSVPEGTQVKVVADGVVRRASEDAVNGRVVIIEHGRGVSTAYCHNSVLLVRTGQAVRAGEVISLSGNTGRSTGPHLHYQLELGHHPMDPFAFRGARPIAVEALAHPPVRKENGSAALKQAFERVGPAPETEE